MDCVYIHEQRDRLRHRHTETDRHSEKFKVREIRETRIATERQTQTQTDRQTDKYTYTYIDTVHRMRETKRIGV